MRTKSHIELGHYLVRQYLNQIPPIHVRAFLWGCVQPDRNPLTYLKGSLRYQWFRGHNYPNTRRFLRRLSRRLERKKSWTVLDYYSLGKLMHYTADAFTYAHNEGFSPDLAQHRKYEESLQKQFLSYLYRNPSIDTPISGSIMEILGGFHREYRREAISIHRDCQFAVRACCCILVLLTVPEVL